jgi:ribonuclease R
VRYSVGSRVRVQVSRVDLDGRKIDFRMVHEGEDDMAASRGRRDKAGEKAAAASAELASIKETDRAVKAAAKGKPRSSAGKGAHPVRAAKSAARKSGNGRSAAKSSRR